jgi:hypothetical protein
MLEFQDHVIDYLRIRRFAGSFVREQSPVAAKETLKNRCTVVI